MPDSLGDRIKSYENVTRFHLTKRTPVLIRVDGRAFHTYTRGFSRPFDRDLILAMIYAADKAAKEMQGFKLGYIQSDEATFILTDDDDLETQAWFDYNVNKMVSIAAAVMSVNFNLYVRKFCPTKLPLAEAVFDARAFNIPPGEVANALLWRAQDWKRNSLQMYCRSIFSSSALHKKNKAAMHDMLQVAGKDWVTDLTHVERNGTFLTNERCNENPMKEMNFIHKYTVLPQWKPIQDLFDECLQRTQDKKNERKEKKDA